MRREKLVRGVAKIGSGLLKRGKAVRDTWWFENSASLLEKLILLGPFSKKTLRIVRLHA